MADQLHMTNVKPRQSPVEQRKTPRLHLALPIQILGQDAPHNKWQEMSRVLDVSRAGACFLLKHPVPPGLILLLSFPMPWKLRQYNHAEPGYKIYAVVRTTIPQKNQEFRTGVEFIGEHPPALYYEKPWTVYPATMWRGEERRRAARLKVSELMWVEYYDGQGHLLAVEQGCTEDISRTGARICVQDPPKEFARVKVFALGKGFETHASLVKQFFGKDGLYRLCVQFIDKQWGLEE